MLKVPFRIIQDELRINNPTLSEYTGQALITFSYDDAPKCQRTIALPLHEKYNIPMTINVVTSYIVPGSSFLEAWEIKNCIRRGVEIASHSHVHLNLTTLTDDGVKYQLLRSKNILSKFTDVKTMAIPGSQYDERVKSIAQNYYAAVRVYGQQLETIPPTDKWWLKCAISLENNTTFAAVKAYIDTAVAEKKWCIIMVHDVVTDGVLTQYQIYASFLEQVLQYVASFDRSVLLPVNTKDGISFITS